MTEAEESYYRSGILVGIQATRRSLAGCLRGDIERRLDWWIENIARWAHKADYFTSFRPPPSFRAPTDLAGCVVPRPAPRVRPSPPRDALADRMVGLRGPDLPEPYVAVTDQRVAGGRVARQILRDQGIDLGHREDSESF